MIDYLTRYYRRGTPPFQCLSALTDDDALPIMQRLADDSPLGVRFKNPLQYMRERRQSEQWTREQFIATGGQPVDAYPIPMVLGDSPWIVKHAPDLAMHAEIRIPLSALTEQDVSFTYPDSMISFWFGAEKPPRYYIPELHGKVFTLQVILAIVEVRGMPEEGWETGLPDDLAPYIEAQVWNHRLLTAFLPREA
ncbi:MAG: hypothetical protein R2844_13650 [Caldilineales bacterium]